MIKLYLLDTDKPLDDEEKRLLWVALPEALREKISKTKDEKLYNERLYAYTLLTAALAEQKENLYFSNKEDKEEPKVCFTEKGKPYVEGCDCDISLSHTDGAVLVAVSTVRFMKIGVDIERIKENGEAVINKFLTRYLGNCELDVKDLHFFLDAPGKIDISLWNLERGGIKKKSSEEITALARDNFKSQTAWCAVEAILKCSGDGFSALPRLEALRRKITPYGMIIEYRNKNFSICVARENVIAPLII